MNVHPVLVRHMISPMLERLLGRRTFDKWRRLREAQWWDADRIQRVQNAKLSRLLKIARDHCPFYARFFQTYGVHPDADDCMGELRRLPPLDKETIRRNLPAMTYRKVGGGAIPFNTGGSTGQPLRFYVDRRRIASDKAARMLTHEWFGAMPGDREVYLWGSPIESASTDSVKRLRDRITNELLLEAFDMSETRIARYLKKINALDPRSLFGYPSSLAVLARFCERNHLPFEGRRLAAVFTTGEVIDSGDRRLLQRFFKAPVADGYGSRDAGFIAHQCPMDRMHVMDHSVIVEVVDENGQPQTPGKAGEILVTHLDAHATMFIRYRTGDMGVMGADRCKCGRSLTILDQVCGRRTDQLVTENGSLAHGLSAVYALRDLPSVRRFQIHQRTDRSIDVRIVADATFGSQERRRIRRGISSKLGASIPISISIVDKIDAQASGKYRQVISDAVSSLADRGQQSTQTMAMENS